MQTAGRVGLGNQSELTDLILRSPDHLMYRMHGHRKWINHGKQHINCRLHIHHMLFAVDYHVQLQLEEDLKQLLVAHRDWYTSYCVCDPGHVQLQLEEDLEQLQVALRDWYTSYCV